jgi:hypothetical protein
LSAGAYLVSKLVVLGLISGLQAVVLVLVGLTGRPLPAQGAILTHLPLVELMLAMFALGVASMTLGLLLSSLVDTSDKAMPLLVVVVMFQVVLSGGIFPLHGKVGLEQAAWLSPSRWGFAATGSTVNLNKVIPPDGSLPALRRPEALPGRAPVTAAKVTVASHGPSPSPSPSVSPSPSQGPVTGQAAPASGTDPVWDHTAKTWLTDMAILLLLAFGYGLLTWWRLIRMGPVKRR